MKKIRIIGLVSLTLLVFTLSSSAKKISSIHFGGALPISDFGDANITNADAGGAGLGANIGLKVDYIFGEDGLGLFGGVNLMYNGLSSKFKDNLESTPIVDKVGDTFYFNVPISIGASYNYKFTDLLTLQGNFGLLANFMKVNDASTEFNGVTTTTEWSPSYATGFKLGAGVILMERVILSVDYFNLGKPKMEGTQDTFIGTIDVEQELPIKVVTIGVGLAF